MTTAEPSTCLTRTRCMQEYPTSCKAPCARPEGHAPVVSHTGNCYTAWRCAHCGHSWDVDSSG